MSDRNLTHRPIVSGARRALKIGLLGCGTVGSPVAKAVLEDGAALTRAAGIPLELGLVAVRRPHRARSVDLPPGLVTTDAVGVAIDPDIDIVVEVMGGIEPAMTSIKAALADNKSVVTANKALLAGPGADLLQDPEVDLHFEASVGGGMPIVRALKESCAGDRIERFTGIFSGTCNFILGEMTHRKRTLDEGLREAQRLGYAEGDATADIEALDAAAKVAILARIAFGIPARSEDVRREGISAISRSMVMDAASHGLVCKLIGSGRRVGDEVELSVKPEFVARNHPLALVEGANNAVLVETRRAGPLTFHGLGAGGGPTAAAILGDLVTAARRRVRARSPLPCLV